MVNPRQNRDSVTVALRYKIYVIAVSGFYTMGRSPVVLVLLLTYCGPACAAELFTFRIVWCFVIVYVFGVLAL